MSFLEHLSPDMIVERLFSRVPEEDAVFSNWGTSWWKLQEELTTKMIEQVSYQGKCYDYINGSALGQLWQQ
jgi:radical SAM superfamily enzyme